MSLSFVVFPDNVWETIISCEQISISDICHLSSTCKRLSSICRSSKSLWRRKFQQCWPVLFRAALVDNPDWFSLVKERTTTAKQVAVFLQNLSKKYCSCKGVYLSHYAFDEFIAYIGNNERLDGYVVDELRQILNRSSNLTHRFYASQAVRFLVHRQLCQSWRKWMDDDIKLLEKGAHLFAQWFQPAIYVEYETIDNFLNEIAEQVKAHLKQSSHTCPLVTSKENINYENITESVWQPDVCKQILLALNFIFCGQYNFTGDSDSYYDLQNSLINRVIERRKGLPITLSILYHAVARRLGVYCYPVNFPSHFVIKFLEHPEMSESLKYTYIDVFNGGRMVSQYDLWFTFHQSSGMPENPNYYDVAPSLAVLLRMVTNVTHVEFKNTDMLCHGLELAVLLEPNNRTRHLLAQCYLQMEINFDKVIDLLNNNDEANEPNEIYRRQYYIKMAEARLLVANQDSDDVVPKLRTGANKHVKFAIGMIMRHKAYDYTCVIAGWDNTCAASTTWQQQMGVHRLERQNNQPFYHVLVNDGSNRYAAEENMLHETSPSEITHGEVGKFFSSFRGNYYEMNEEYRALYPEDSAFVKKCVSPSKN